MVLTLGDNLEASDINKRLNAVVDIEAQNVHNPNFNSLTDPKVIYHTKGVANDAVFEMENTVIDS
jgi:hypothetical protein